MLKDEDHQENPTTKCTFELQTNIHDAKRLATTRQSNSKWEQCQSKRQREKERERDKCGVDIRVMANRQNVN